VTVLVNGVRDADASPVDRGLHYGDGLFETIACRNGVPRFLSLHLERLALGCRRLNIDASGLEDTRTEVLGLAREADRAIIKVLMTRGVALARGYATAGSEKATRITIRYSWPHEDSAQLHDGVLVRTCAMRLGENPYLAGLKHCNRLEQILARAEWPADSDITEGILFSSSGRLASGTMSNIFIVRGSTVLTPNVDRCGVAGVMRRVVLREAQRAGIPTREGDLQARELNCAEEIFLTNARMGIWPVRALDGRRMTPGPITRRLQSLLAPLLEEPANA
jgi:4-amino-4-deoxychorismate lyase